MNPSCSTSACVIIRPKLVRRMGGVVVDATCVCSRRNETHKTSGLDPNLVVRFKMHYHQNFHLNIIHYKRLYFKKTPTGGYLDSIYSLYIRISLLLQVFTYFYNIRF